MTNTKTAIALAMGIMFVGVVFATGIAAIGVSLFNMITQ